MERWHFIYDVNYVDAHVHVPDVRKIQKIVNIFLVINFFEILFKFHRMLSFHSVFADEGCSARIKINVLF